MTRHRTYFFFPDGCYKAKRYAENESSIKAMDCDSQSAFIDVKTYSDPILLDAGDVCFFR